MNKYFLNNTKTTLKSPQNDFFDPYFVKSPLSTWQKLSIFSSIFDSYAPKLPNRHIIKKSFP